MINEFKLIEKYFKQPIAKHSDIIKSIGDDCAVLKPQKDKLLVLSTDTLIEGVHFPKQTSAADIAYKSLAVNLSDLAAMGAKPSWFTLALTITDDIDERWVKNFSQQLHKMSIDYDMPLIGGDTTKGTELSITIQVHGYIGKHLMLRSKAQEGDIILLSGEVGAAALGLELALNGKSLFSNLSALDVGSALEALNRPKPEIDKGQKIAPFCQCGIDVSDGLLADLGHILEQSHCGAKINLADIPLASCLKSLDENIALRMALTGGDDYKLCLTLPKHCWDNFKQNDFAIENDFYVIGQICKGKGITLFDKLQQPVNEIDGFNLETLTKGYNHFD